MKNAAAKTKRKNSFKAKTRIVAMILAVITALSVMTVSVGSVSAAECDAAASNAIAANSLDANSLISDVTTSVAKKGIEIATSGNPAAQILGAGISTVFSTLFGSLFGGSDAVLSEVQNLSNKVDAYHAEEMGALLNIQELLQDTQDKIDLQPFKNTCDDMCAIYTSVYKQLDYYKDSISDTTDGYGLIDDNTYIAYSDILTKVGFTTSIEVDKPFNKMCHYLYADNDNLYQTIADKYFISVENSVFAQSANGAVNLKALGDCCDVKSEIEQTEAETVLYYTAYLALLQMDYQCANYEYQSKHTAGEPAYDEVKMNAIKNQIEDIGNQMQKIDDAFTTVCNSIDSIKAAHVTATGNYDGSSETVTRYFSSIPLAWSVAVNQAQNGCETVLTLDNDWIAANSTYGLALNSKFLNKTGFTGNGGLTANISGPFTVDLNAHKIDFSANDGITVFDISGKNDFTLTSLCEQDVAPAKLKAQIIGGGTTLHFKDNHSHNDGSVVTVSNVCVQSPKTMIVDIYGNSKKIKTYLKIHNCYLCGNIKYDDNKSAAVWIKYGKGSMDKTLVNNTYIKKLKNEVELYNPNKRILDLSGFFEFGSNVELYSSTGTNPALYGN